MPDLSMNVSSVKLRSAVLQHHDHLILYVVLLYSSKKRCACRLPLIADVMAEHKDLSRMMNGMKIQSNLSQKSNPSHAFRIINNSLKSTFINSLLAFRLCPCGSVRTYPGITGMGMLHFRTTTQQGHWSTGGY